MKSILVKLPVEKATTICGSY